MKIVWTGVLVMLSGMIWDILSGLPEEEHHHGIDPSSYLILLGGIIALTAIFLIKRSTSTLHSVVFSVTSLSSLSLIIGWVWDYIGYHTLELDTKLQPIAHILYSAGMFLLLFSVVLGSILSVIRTYSDKKNVKLER